MDPIGKRALNAFCWEGIVDIVMRLSVYVWLDCGNAVQTGDAKKKKWVFKGCIRRRWSVIYVIYLCSLCIIVK